MKNWLNKWITRLAGFIEIAVSILILISILLASVSLVQEMGLFDGKLLTVDTFEGFLGHALALVIGLEFIKMLIKHTPGACYRSASVRHRPPDHRVPHHDPGNPDRHPGGCGDFCHPQVPFRAHL